MLPKRSTLISGSPSAWKKIGLTGLPVSCFGAAKAKLPAVWTGGRAAAAAMVSGFAGGLDASSRNNPVSPLKLINTIDATQRRLDFMILRLFQRPPGRLLAQQLCGPCE